ncbi:MAG TPA: hypothetical protein VL137_14110 [Polyangiaceae bacterium]|nr:hypothetical protein [Polyangiaceae bacterium]
MTPAKPPAILYGAIGVLMFAVVCEAMYIAYLRGKAAHATASGATLAAESPVRSPSVTGQSAPAARAGNVPTTPPPAQLPGGRVLTPEQRSAMLAKLGGSGQLASSSPVWFATSTSDPEAVAFQRALQAVFEEANWQVIDVSSIHFQAKPGIFMFAADEEPPEYVQAASDALDAAGLKPMVGRGYRDFFKEKKKENPNWNGFELSESQTYVIVVGRKPDDNAAAAPSSSAK